MRIGIIGGGAVGQTLGGAFKARGHDVVLGIRDPSSADALSKPRQGARPLGEWRDAADARVATMAEAAAQGEVVVNATQGIGSLDALRLAGAGNLGGKVLIDVSNPLDFSQGGSPTLLPAYSGRTSLAEAIQAAAPGARVVKAFNTVAAALMIDPGLISEEHDLFLCGNDEGAKEVVRALARGLGWSRFTDLGDLTGARAQEQLILVWLRLWTVGGTPNFGYRIVR